MSNRPHDRPRSYGQRARDAFPDYVAPGAPCDVPSCDQPVTGSRTFTFVSEHQGDDLSVLVALCTRHTLMPYQDLLPLLPELQEIAEIAETAGAPVWSQPEP
jgi:hypothetical protein